MTYSAIIPSTSTRFEDIILYRTPEERDRLIFQVLAATVEKVMNLESNLQQSNRTVNELSTQLRSAHNEVNSLYSSINMQRLQTTEKKAEKYFAEHNDVWEHRVLKAILFLNPTSRAEAIAAAIRTNKEVRRQLREYIDNYHGRNRICCLRNLDKQETLLGLAKLTLRADPLITWTQLHSKLAKAEGTLNAMPNVGELYVQRAAQRLFENIDIDSHTLVTYYVKKYDNDIPDFSD